MANLEITFTQQDDNILIRNPNTSKYEMVQMASPKKHAKQAEIIVTNRQSIAAHVVAQIATA